MIIFLIRYLRWNTVPRSVLVESILFMFFCDTGFSFIFMLIYFFALFNRRIYSSHDSCVVIGTLISFFTIGSVTWNFILSIFTLLLVLNCISGIRFLQRWRKIFFIIIWIFPTVTSIIPAVVGAYGPLDKPLPFICWISQETSPHRLWLYGLLLLYFLFAIILLPCILVLFICSNHEDAVIVTHNAHQRGVLFRLIATVVAFVMIYSIPIIVRIWPFIDANPSMSAAWRSLLAVVPIFFGASGLANFLVWFSSYNVRKLFFPICCCKEEEVPRKRWMSTHEYTVHDDLQSRTTRGGDQSHTITDDIRSRDDLRSYDDLRSHTLYDELPRLEEGLWQMGKSKSST